jgi:asparagine synthase (glutamine-hydrolysing)
MYFYNAPSDEDYERESIRLLKDICYFDVLRSDRSISSHGLEPRTPFLDKTFVAISKSIAVGLRRPLKGIQSEKWILREAFEGLDLLPREVLWRKKEAFSDGVSGPQKLWYQEIQERLLTSRIFSAFEGGSGDPMKADPEWNYHMKPETEEDIYYRFLFEKSYKGKAQVIPYKWMPRWCDGATDPSARTLKTYEEA